MKTFIKFVLILLVAALLVAAGFGYGRWYSTRPASVANARTVLYYVDAMHPWYKSDKPGIAPDCGMKLVPVYADGKQGEAAQETRKVLRYEDPKDPKYTSDKPGLNPDTGNDLQPVYEAGPPNAFQLGQDKQQAIGVRYEVAGLSLAGDALRANGRVVADETRTIRIQARTEGWIDTVAADFTGKLIQKGQALFTLYSPDMLATQQELLLAMRGHKMMQGSSMEGSEANAMAMVGAARRRLELLKMPPEQIDEVQRTGQAIHSITVYAPAGGYVITRNAFPGQRVTPETELYTLTDLSRVWVMADVFEVDAARVRVGQAARVVLPGGGHLTARITYIQPQVDAATRTMKVRLELENPENRLKPDMYVDVAIDPGSTRRLMVSAEAVIDTGVTRTIFIDHGNGSLEPRQVETGARIGDRIEILKGLKTGERYAASGVFLLNSENQMKAGPK
ncbi:MAG TPA: efflux RND transporter periplasmic adaptor subunit [Bryobacteraceae bacterium]|nr:efflux RND transporter periplasmic adaptor subunit [Bryobacteraceae bacterium]